MKPDRVWLCKFTGGPVTCTHDTCRPTEPVAQPGRRYVWIRPNGGFTTVVGHSTGMVVVLEPPGVQSCLVSFNPRAMAIFPEDRS